MKYPYPLYGFSSRHGTIILKFCDPQCKKLVQNQSDFSLILDTSIRIFLIFFTNTVQGHSHPLVINGLNSSNAKSTKTFKAHKSIPEEAYQHELLKHTQATLGSGNLRQAVVLPEGENLNEWIAVNSKL